MSPDPASKTNPLVRLYLLPDRSKRTRRVTKELSGTLNGVLNETFEYIVGLDQLRTMQIDIAVKSDRGFKIGRARNRLIGTAVVDLSQKALSDGCDVTCELRKFSLTFWPDTNRVLLDFKNSWILTSYLKLVIRQNFRGLSLIRVAGGGGGGVGVQNIPNRERSLSPVGE